MRLWLALLSLISPFCLAANDFGAQLSLLETQGQPRLSITFDTKQPLFFASFVVDGRTLASKPIRILAIRAWDDLNKKYLGDWESILTLPSAVYLPKDFTGNWWVDSSEKTHSLIQAIPHLKLVIGSSANETRNFTVIGFIDLASYCRSTPKAFLNLLTQRPGC